MIDIVHTNVKMTSHLRIPGFRASCHAFCGVGISNSAT